MISKLMTLDPMFIIFSIEKTQVHGHIKMEMTIGRYTIIKMTNNFLFFLSNVVDSYTHNKFFLLVSPPKFLSH